MTEYNVDLELPNYGTRNELRMKLVQIFATEVPGIGKGELASRYTYYVETLNDSNRIYLRRPANLHNGFDFLVCVENINFNPNGKRKRNYPTHNDIWEDLRNKNLEKPQQYLTLHNSLETIYNCQEPDWDNLESLTFTTGFPCDLLAKTLKWLFIEQDIRYWNYSGRNMLWDGIRSILTDNPTHF